MRSTGYFADSVDDPDELDPDALEDYDAEPPEVVLQESEGASPRMKAYFESLIRGCLHEYTLAERCRALGLDPETRVEIPRAEDLAARVEELVGPKGVAARIRELSRQMNREAVSLLVAKEVAAGTFGRYDTREAALDAAIRTGLAILTEGILVAPLEGIAGVRILKNDDGTDCVAVSFAGPIRAAGGTGQALSVLIADVVRRELGIGKYKPTAAEVDRFKEEIPAYKMAQHLQYTPTPQEIEAIARGCPVMIDGEKTEDAEVSGNRDLPRIETNHLRGGACLVLAEGLILKAPKVQKHVQALALDGWEFISHFVNKSAAASGPVDKDAKPRIDPNPKYMLELVAGRPVLSHPSRAGGWRLRYGRSRTAGLATTSLHPAAMALCDDFLAVGTQMKIERPGKATAVTPCEGIEGPIALLYNGSLVEILDVKQARELRAAVKSIVDLGEILIPFGEFAENNKTLPQASYCVEWWEQEAERAGATPDELRAPGSARQAVALAERLKVPLHPRYNLFWHDLAADEVERLSASVEATGRLEGDRLVVENEPEAKETLTILGALHDVRPRADGAAGTEVVVGRHAYALVRALGLDGAPDGKVVRIQPLGALPGEDTCAYVSRLAGVRIRERAPARIGARMGRPEKAAERKMSPPVHVLFPVANAGGPQRLVSEAVKAGALDVEVGTRQCPQCREKTILNVCPRCKQPDGRSVHTEAVAVRGEGPRPRVEPQRVDLPALAERARQTLGLDRLPESVKGVQGLISARKTPEPLEKGYLRAAHGVFTFKDGTARFDMTDVTLTHFRPDEIHTPVERLRGFGYTHDVHGAPLERDDQVLELFPQDIVVSTTCLEYMLKTSRYLDDLLVRFYGYKPYYNCERKEDLVGQLFVGLAPHTSGGVLCRVIGHTTAQAGFGHPFFHAAKRRNCFRGDTEILVYDNGRARKSRLDTLVDAEIERSGHPVDAYGTLVADAPPSLEALSLDPETLAPRRLPIRKLLRGRTDAWIEIETSTHRTIRVTPDHRVLVRRDGKLVDVAASDVVEGEQVPVGLSLPRDPRVPRFHLGELLAGEAEAATLRIRHADAALRALAERLGDDFSRTTDLPAVARTFASMPLSAYAALVRSGAAAWDDLPHEARLGFARDDTEHPLWLDVDGDLCWLLGLYVAEGHARSSASAHQISWRVPERELSARLVRALERSFSRTPSLGEDGTKITLASRIAYLLFTRAWKTGANAHEKRFPAWVFDLPDDLLVEVVAGFFDGDGSVVAEPPRVQFYSANMALLEDVALALQALGIFARFAPGRPRAPGAFLARRYEALGRKAPDELGAVHALTLGGVDIKHFAAAVAARHPRKRERLMHLTEAGRDSRVIQVHGVQHDPEAGAHALFDRVLRVSRVDVAGEATYCIDVDSGSEDLPTKNVLLGNGLYTIRCDGDEDCVMLLLDGLLNFSRSYLPSSRGGLMDAPLTLTLRLDPSEVDKEAHNVDVMWRYPLEFFEATCRHPQPGEVAKLIDSVSKRLGKHGQYEGFGFTHDTPDIAAGPSASAYKTIGDMLTKMTAQLDLGAKIRAVDAPDVAARVIGSHFLPDLMGNLKAFSKQKVRCTKCGAKFRRIPLSGKCHKCGQANLTMTVYEASVRKYLEVSKEICERYGVNPYVRQRIEHIEDSIESLFQNDRVKKARLTDFL